MKFLRCVCLLGTFAVFTALGAGNNAANEPRDSIRREAIQVHPALTNMSAGGPPRSLKKDASGKSTLVEEEPYPRVGDRMTIWGTYNLVSQEKARITLIQNLKKKSRQLPVSLPSIEVKKGSGNFELTCDLQAEGSLWLVFTSIPDGKPGPSQSYVEEVRAAWKGELGPEQPATETPSSDKPR